MPRTVVRQFWLMLCWRCSLLPSWISSRDKGAQRASGRRRRRTGMLILPHGHSQRPGLRSSLIALHPGWRFREERLFPRAKRTCLTPAATACAACAVLGRVGCVPRNGRGRGIPRVFGSKGSEATQGTWDGGPRGAPGYNEREVRGNETGTMSLHHGATDCHERLHTPSARCADQRAPERGRTTANSHASATTAPAPTPVLKEKRCNSLQGRGRGELCAHRGRKDESPHLNRPSSPKAGLPRPKPPP